MEKRVLVFPCGSETGLEINRAISYSKHFELYGASSTSSNHGKYVFNNYLEIKSYVYEKGFIHELNEVIKKYGIDYIFPAHDDVVVKLSQNIDKICCDIICSPVETCTICRSKKETYEKFKNKINTPYLYNSVDDIMKYPVFLKPDIGQGSKGTHIANSKDEVEFFIKQDKILLIMEYLPNKEYTIDCFTDKDSNLIFIGARERKRIYNGISVDTFPVYNEKFNQMAEIINNTLEFRGVWFFQVKARENGEYVLLEVAPRVAGSMGLYRNLGANLPILSLYDRMEYDLKINKINVEMFMDRALTCRYTLAYSYDNVYIDLDDTIIFQNKINPLVIAFLYQCLNEDKKIYLITKHINSLNEILEKFRIKYIFDNIIQIGEHEEKYTYIESKSSIFIDDSFAERLKVSEKLEIPVFDVNNIECLLDWKV